MSCYCQNTLEFSECCEPILNGKKAPTAESLMRARFSAYVTKDMNFIEKSHDPKTLKNTDMEANLQWAKDTEWKSLSILSVTDGLEADERGVVEFSAEYTSGGKEGQHHEISEFVKRAGRWYFSSGKFPENRQIINQEARVGRNDPCPCGSGKKFKKCCA